MIGHKPFEDQILSIADFALTLLIVSPTVNFLNRKGTPSLMMVSEPQLVMLNFCTAVTSPLVFLCMNTFVSLYIRSLKRTILSVGGVPPN